MSNADIVEFWQAVLITEFLACLYTLIPNLLSVITTSTQAHNPRISSFFAHLHRHNPLTQWFAERRIFSELVARGISYIPSSSVQSINITNLRENICPNRRWLKVVIAHFLIYRVADILGALTILAQVVVPVESSTETHLIPAFPVQSGINKMTIRGNCKWTMTKGSGSADTVGFIVYQLCADVLPHDVSEPLRRNEIIVNSGGKTWKAILSLETITGTGIDEHWRISPDNEDQLSQARGPRDYLKDCDGECMKTKRGDSIELAIINQILKECGMVKRTLKHYDASKPDFDPNRELKPTRTRLRQEAIYVMVTVLILTWFWRMLDLSKTSNETYYAISIRLFRQISGSKFNSVETSLNGNPDMRPLFLEDSVVQTVKCKHQSNDDPSRRNDMDQLRKKVIEETKAGESQIEIENICTSPNKNENSDLSITVKRSVARYTYSSFHLEEARKELPIAESDNWNRK